MNPIENGSIKHVAVQIPQIFHRIDVSSIQSSFDQRFDYFINTILPQFKAASKAHTLIFIPSYFDFVRIRNYFKKETMNFTQICEYTKVNWLESDSFYWDFIEMCVLLLYRTPRLTEPEECSSTAGPILCFILNVHTFSDEHGSRAFDIWSCINRRLGHISTLKW